MLSRTIAEPTRAHALPIPERAGSPARRLALSALLCAVLLALLPGTGRAASFGFSEPASCATWTGTLCTAWSGGLGSDAKLASFQTLKAKLPLKYARFSVPYNAVADYDQRARRCRPSLPFSSPTVDDHGYERAAEEWNLLRSELVLAHGQGLAVMVSITDGRVVHGAESDALWPIPIYWDGKRYRATVAGMDYRCGVAALVARVASEQRALGAPPAQWEAFNEPDARRSYNGTLQGACRGTHNGCKGSYRALCAPRVRAQCGPLQAASLYAAFVTSMRVSRIAGKVAAGTFTRAGAYAVGYLHQLLGTLHTRPAVISFHDYIDPTADSTALAHDFAVRLYRNFGKRFELWITESGVYLGEWAPLPRAGGSSRAHGCEFGTNRAPGLQGLGRCINGNERAQAAGAANFKYHLAQRGSYRGVRITELFWYQYRALAPSASRPVQWDSGLLDAGGVPRASYCVLTGNTRCTGNPNRNR
jgi:hypothetical protein